MIYLLGVTVAAVAFGRGPAILASVLSVGGVRLLLRAAAVPVRGHRHAVPRDVRRHAGGGGGDRHADGPHARAGQAARARERRTAALYQLSRELAAARSVPRAAGRRGRTHAGRVRARASRCCCPVTDGVLASAGGDADLFGGGEHELGVAQWAFDHAEPAGLGTDTLPGSRALHLPLVASGAALGVLALRPRDAAPLTRSGPLPAAADVREPDRARARARAARRARRGTRAWTPRPNARATRCSRPCRTTCARRWR